MHMPMLLIKILPIGIHQDMTTMEMNIVIFNMAILHYENVPAHTDHTDTYNNWPHQNTGYMNVPRIDGHINTYTDRPHQNCIAILPIKIIIQIILLQSIITMEIVSIETTVTLLLRPMEIIQIMQNTVMHLNIWIWDNK